MGQTVNGKKNISWILKRGMLRGVLVGTCMVVGEFFYWSESTGRFRVSRFRTRYGVKDSAVGRIEWRG
jgi:hypothetical protein